ncbi:DNA polymerase I [Alkalibacter mobilis]|uniref:DNA polymerase I n=1 Tax=Alkalibacter mobilis TaxID=2787712 RepID=UPI00189C73ED|nr:DNA polymerase I [Alkalibacter mobilis]MBF7096536.1 DNA polymerase I [Alkalibacter mobilis]
MDNKRLIIIDGFSLIYRMFYGVRPMATKDGIPTNVVYGLGNLLINILENFKPDYIGVAFDESGPTFRHESYNEYKAGRMLMPEDLEVQIAHVMKMLDLMDIKKISLEGFEADDIIGTISKICSENGIEVDILTGDRDAFQLINNKVKVLYTKKGISDVDIFDEDKIISDYGLSPRDLIDVKALMGDKSDNIPGIAGVGEKTAVKLIKEYGDLDGVYENIEEIKGKLQEKLINDKENAYLSKHLAEIIREVPLVFELDEYKTLDYGNKEVIDFFNDLECHSIVKRLAGEDKLAEVQKEITDSKIVVINADEDFSRLKEKILVQEKLYVTYITEKTDIVNLKAISFYFEDKCYYISSNHITENVMIKELKEIFESKSLGKYCYDAKDLLTWSLGRNIDFNSLKFDGFLASYLLDPSDSRYGLSEIVSKYFGIEIPSHEEVFGKGKSRKKFTEVDEETVKNYMCTQSSMIPEIFVKLEKLLEESGMISLFHDIELPLVEVLASFEHEGFTIDQEELDKLDIEFDSILENLTQKIYSLAGKEFNINSPKQLGEILFDDLKLPVIKKTKTGYSTDAEVLEKLSDKHPVVESILEYRTVAKLSSTYVKGFKQIINKRTGKIHSTFNQALTSTGRISSSDPNLQNIPIKIEMGKKIRKIFVPSKETNKLLDADYSQIELRILAHISCDKTLIESFKRGEDIHTRTASEIFNVKLDEVEPRQRMYAKTINFGLIYGKQAYGLSQDLQISRKEAQEYIDRYFGRYPGVEEYMKNIVNEANEKGYVTTIFGRRRFIPEINSRNAMIAKSGERLALNTPIQGSAADIIKIAMINVYGELKKRKLKSKLILTVHDELVLDCPIEEIREVRKLVVDKMENAAKLKVPMTVEISEGNNWYEAK